MRIRILYLGAVSCLAFSLYAAAQEPAVDADDAASQQTQTDSNPPVSAPPPLVAPAAADSVAVQLTDLMYIPPTPMNSFVVRTEGAGSRGGSKPSFPAVVALAPNHVGLVASEQPTLYFFLEEPGDAGIVFQLVETTRGETLLAIIVPGPLPRGIHPLRLADHEVQLEVGARYEWSVLSASAPADAGDSVSIGWIERKTPPQPLVEALAADPDRAVHAFAKSGFWYDAFAAASDRLADSPDAQSQRATLLEAVYLDKVAQAERESPR